MDETTKMCYHQDHSNIEAVYFCIECKIYICNKCENFHSKLFKNHHKYTLDKNKNISEIFTGFCKEENHLDKLEFFCKTHNQLCCAGCITKIKIKDKGQHNDCEICSLEDIKESKENLLKENILNLEKLSKEMNVLINEIKVVFEKINKDKEELKLNIQKIFTKIRNAINEREDEILSKVDELFDNVYIKESEMNEIDKYPNKIKMLLKQGKSTIEQWNKEICEQNELSYLMYNCINIEKTLLNINNMEQNLKRCKTEMTSVIKFSPFELNELNKFISNITSFGRVYKENKYLNKDKDNEIQPKNIEENVFDIRIKSSKEELNNLSFNLSHFSNEEYNNYYPNDAIFKENEFILTIHLDGKTDFNNYIYFQKENIELIFKSLNLSIRKRENKLYLELKNTGNIVYLYEFLLSHCKIFMKFISNLTFENFGKMDIEEFIKLLSSFDILIQGSCNNLENSLISFLQSKIDLEKNEKNFIEKALKFLLFNKNVKFNLDISQDKLFNFLNEKLKQNFEDIVKMIMIFLQDVVINYLINYGFSNIYEDINFKKILVTLLFAKFKSGFVLEINTKGINELLKNLINEKNKK